MKRSFCKRTCCAAALAFLAYANVGSISWASTTPSFQVLVPPPSFGNPVYGDGISPDGSTVIAQWFLAGTDPGCGIPGGCSRALLWTSAGGFPDPGPDGGGGGAGPHPRRPRRPGPAAGGRAAPVLRAAPSR